MRREATANQMVRFCWTQCMMKQQSTLLVILPSAPCKVYGSGASKPGSLPASPSLAFSPRSLRHPSRLADLDLQLALPHFVSPSHTCLIHIWPRYPRRMPYLESLMHFG